jgi:hypothetical protein
MKWWNRAFETPYVLGKKFESMAQAVATEIWGAETRSTILHKDLEGELGDLISNFDKIRHWTRKERQGFKNLIWRWDGKRMPRDKVPTNAIETTEDPNRC